MNPVISLSHTPCLTNPVRDAQQAFRAILEALARGDEGFLLSMGYSTQRGYGNNHPFVGEVRGVEVGVELEVEFAVEFYAPSQGTPCPSDAVSRRSARWPANSWAALMKHHSSPVATGLSLAGQSAGPGQCRS